MKKIPKTILFEIHNSPNGKKNPQLLRVILNEEHTRIDFGYHTYPLYINGGWIKIAPETFIEVKETKKRYLLTKALNIPVSPDKLHFESQKDWQFFSLYFEPLPQINCTINVIEDENPTRDDFNYYDIELLMQDGVRVKEALIY